MSNLGAYQWITTVSKKVGGPKRLLGLVFVSGAIGCKAVEFMYQKCVDFTKKYFVKKDIRRYLVTKNGVSNEGLVLNVGDEFDVLEVDGDVILISKVNDEDNPYFVTSDLLKAISNFNT